MGRVCALHRGHQSSPPHAVSSGRECICMLPGTKVLQCGSGRGQARSRTCRLSASASVLSFSNPKHSEGVLCPPALGWDGHTLPPRMGGRSSKAHCLLLSHHFTHVIPELFFSQGGHFYSGRKITHFCTLVTSPKRAGTLTGDTECLPKPSLVHLCSNIATDSGSAFKNITLF